MIKLSDTQSILLSTASQRADGSLLPIPVTVKPGGSVSKSIEALIARGLAEERETSDAVAVIRTSGEVRFGVFSTVAGLAAIGVLEPSTGTHDGVDNGVATSPAPLVAKGPTKAATVIELLERPSGASLPEIIAATGWLPHTTRAALTGIRKKGHVVERMKLEGVTCYRIIGTN